MGKAKALVAAEVAQRFNSTGLITPYHANIKGGEFDIDFFRQFQVVLSALDNVVRIIFNYTRLFYYNINILLTNVNVVVHPRRVIRMLDVM